MFYIPVSNTELMIVDDASMFLASTWGLDTNGYPRATIGGKKVYAHKIVNPNGRVDHINRDPLDNRRCNLRPTTMAQNSFNAIWSNNTSGFKGVVKKGNGWQAQIKIAGKKKYLGMFKHKSDAAQAYNYAAYKAAREFAVLNEAEDSIIWLREDLK